jgi:hypothetical protein
MNARSGLVLALALFFASCDKSSSDAEGMLPSSNGAALEVLVVADDGLWNSKAGFALRSVLQAPVQGLPQTEPLLKVVQIDPSELQSLMRRSRNMVFLKTGGAANFQSTKDRWASPQNVWLFEASSPDSLEWVVRKQAPVMASQVLAAERLQLLRRLKAKPSTKSLFMREHGLEFELIPGFKLTTDQPDVAVFWNRKTRSDQCIIMYSRSFDEDSLASGQGWLEARNDIAKRYVPGQFDGSYMMTETDPAPVFKPMNFRGLFGYEVRGLWKVHGDFMGGPFLSYSLYDEGSNRIITVEGFCFAPEIDKRALMFELESMLHTVKLSKAASKSPSATSTGK